MDKYKPLTLAGDVLRRVFAEWTEWVSWSLRPSPERRSKAP